MIYKRGKYWWYKFTWNGETIRQSTKQTNKRAAETMEAAHRTQLAMGGIGLGTAAKKKKPVPAAVPTLTEFAERFRQHVEIECKPGTVTFYTQRLRCLLADPVLPNCRLDEIDEAVVDAFKQRRSKTVSSRGRPFAVASVNRELQTLRRILHIAQDWKILRYIPRIRKLRGEREREYVLSATQETEYLNALSEDLKDISLLIIDTGLRMGEVLSLSVSDVRLTPPEGAQYGFLTVRAHNAKNSKSRNIPISSRVSEMLARRITDVEAGPVFRGADGSRLNHRWLNEQLRTVRARFKLNPELVFHSLRHTFGTRLGESGTESNAIKKLMGHSSLTVTQRYVHPSPETLENAVRRLEAMNERKKADSAAPPKDATKSA